MNKKYKEYLASNHWKSLKALKAKKTPKRCAICGYDKQVDCHHSTYKNLTGVTAGDLRWLCRKCHDTAHILMKKGKIKFKNPSNNSKFILTKHAVKRFLGYNRDNMFWPEFEHNKPAQIEYYIPETATPARHSDIVEWLDE